MPNFVPELDLAGFLLARIAEDARVARSMPFAATWGAYPEEIGQPIRAGKARIATCAESVMAHIARHDPARVLAECEAKRRLIDWAAPESGAERVPTARPGVYDVRPTRYVSDDGEDVLKMLALPYADHPDYNESWRP